MMIGVDGFHVRCGVRQGVLSPYLFVVYIDDIIVQMRNSGFDILIGSASAGCLYEERHRRRIIVRRRLPFAFYAKRQVCLSYDHLLFI